MTAGGKVENYGVPVSNSRNLALKLNGLLDERVEANRKFFLRIIPLYAEVLKNPSPIRFNPSCIE